MFELTNPLHNVDKKRQALMAKEIKLSLQALVLICMYVCAWIWLVEPKMPYFNYYLTHTYTPYLFLKEGMTYFFLFDSVGITKTKAKLIFFKFHRFQKKVVLLDSSIIAH